MGIVVIGRNEGELLKDALSSLPSDDWMVPLYVDSGSTDGSVELARSMGIAVHELDPDRPFSPARARREGVEWLLSRNPELEYLQFLDGDCMLGTDWIYRAVEYLGDHEGVGIVCGQVEERHPERSIYNRFAALQRVQPIGDITSSGGIFLIRSTSYLEAGGFDERLITREEKDLCDRVLGQGHRVRRLPIPMAVHDSGLLHFRQWWQRAIWGGYGDATQIWHERRQGKLSLEHRQRIRTYLTWPVGLPAVAALGLIGGLWSKSMLLLPISVILAYMLLFLRFTLRQWRAGDRIENALKIALLMVTRKFATGYGFVLHWLQAVRGKLHQPDAHST